MKILHRLFALLALLPVTALAQPGPGPSPNPWLLNGAQVYYNRGCVNVSAVAPGTCHGAGSFTTDNLYATTLATFPTPFTLGATSVTTTGTRLNYLTSATGTTGTASSNLVFSASPTFSGTVGGTAILPLTGLSTIATNTVLGNATSGTAAVVAQAVPSCSTSASAITWTTNTGWGCNTLSSSFVTTLNFSTTGLTPSSATSGAITVAGTLVPANGGTGIASYAIGDIPYASASTTISKLADVATGNALISGGVTTAPSYGKIGLTTHVSGTLAVGNGGTGLASFTTGDLPYASASTTIAGLADIATGNALITGGVGVAPSYGKIGLTTHVSGTLAVGNGGSGAATFTANGVLYGNTTSAFGVTAAGTTGQYFKGVTSGAPAWGTLSSDAVTALSFGSTGLTPSTGTQGSITVAGTLIAANGGTGFASYAVGDLLYADTTTTLAKRAAVATGQVLVSAGTGTAPAYTGSPVLSGSISDSIGNVRDIVQSGSDKTSNYSLVATDRGQFIGLGASGAITIPNSTLSAGEVVNIVNNTSSTATITVNTTTGYITGSNTNKGGGGTVTLAIRGVATILFYSTTVCYISGNVS